MLQCTHDLTDRLGVSAQQQVSAQLISHTS